MNWETVDIALYFFINLFDLWVILRYFNRLLEPRKQKNFILYGMYFLFLLFFTLLIQYELKYSNLVSITVWSCMFLPAYQGEKRNKLVFAFFLLGAAGFSQMTMFFIVHNNVHTVYSYFIPHFIFLLITELAVRYQTVKGKVIESKLLLLLLSVPLSSFLAMPCMVLISEQMDGISLQEETALLLPIAILILYMNIIVFYLYDTISSSFYVKKQKNEYEQQLKWQQTYYDSLAENQDVIRKLKHDMQNHLQVVSRLLMEEKTEEAGKYMNELIGEQEQVNHLVITGNEAIDTVLNIKFSLAHQYGIQIKKNINIPSGLPIPYQHCIRIFGNLLDNAIYAVKDCVGIEKTIDWLMFYQANALVIQISNQYKDRPVKCNRDNFLHGLGLDIVKATTELYDGIFEAADDGENFTVNIMLYLRDK